MPPSLDRRVAYVEGRTEEHAGMIDGVRADVRDLRTDVSAFRAEMHGEISSLRGEMREFRAEMIRRFEHVDTRSNWMLGLLFAVVLAVVSAVLSLR